MRWFRGSQPPEVLEALATQGRAVVRATGFSLLELERAGVTAADAEALGIPMDPVRCSSLGSNVMQLRRFLARRQEPR